jgi:mannose-1-phosphate guanylyltransferase
MVAWRGPRRDDERAPTPAPRYPPACTDDPSRRSSWPAARATRFWPLSTADRPKQFLDLERTGRTLLQATFDRLLPLTGGPEGIYVATAARYRELVREQLPEVPAAPGPGRAHPRDSGPPIALASLAIHRRTGGATLGFFSSDHRIPDADAFRAAVRDAIELAEAERGLVTLGIAPTHPATAYGYIERGEAVGPGYRVARFVEKPNADRARQYLEAGGFDWNAGIFVWRSDVILERTRPSTRRHHANPLLAAADDALDDVFPTLPRRSIDYAVMEHTAAPSWCPSTAAGTTSATGSRSSACWRPTPTPTPSSAPTWATRRAAT